MMTPQLTEQYGQVLRVSVVRAIFRPCVWAYTGARLNPKTVTPAPPINVVLMNVRLETSMASHSSTIKLEMGGRTTRGTLQLRGKLKQLYTPTKFNSIFV